MALEAEIRRELDRSLRWIVGSILRGIRLCRLEEDSGVDSTVGLENVDFFNWFSMIFGVGVECVYFLLLFH